jgi:hypothetical protein
MTARVQFPLTLFLPLKTDKAAEVREMFKKSDSAGGALASTGLVHFARLFVFEENNIMGIPSNIAVVSTTYDGDFAAYVQAFVDNQGAAEVFNMLLSVADVPGAADLIPVQKNAQAFAALVAKYDATNVLSHPWGQWFSAYPGATVQNVQAALKNQS